MNNTFIPYIINSYPRSGNHWVRYIVEWFSGQMTLGDKEGEHPKDIKNKMDTPIYKRAKILHMDINKPPIAKKRHFINTWDNKDAKLLLLLRDYKECIPRHLEIGNKYNLNIDNIAVKNQINNYFDIITIYDNWESNKKHVFYEDLIYCSPKFDTTLKELLNFFDIFDQVLYKEFIKNIDYHIKNSIGTLHAKSKTGGKHMHYHAKKLSIEQKQNWNRYITQNYKKYKDNYLKKYE